MSAATATISRLIGVYDADGSVIGELTYLVRARFGRAHCALCDVTHGALRERSAWRTSRAQLRVPFVTYHRDDQPPEVRAAAGSVTPVVVAETADGNIVVLAKPEELEECAGSPERLVQHIESAAITRGLSWPQD